MSDSEDGTRVKWFAVVAAPAHRRPGTLVPPPFESPEVVTVRAADAAAARAAALQHLVFGSEVFAVLEIAARDAVWQGKRLRRLERPTGPMCPACGGAELKPFRGGQDPSWSTCAACGHEALQDVFDE